MSNQKFLDLIDDTFDNGSINLKFLERAIRHIVNKLDLENDVVEDTGKCKRLNDHVEKLLPKDENNLTDVIDLLNITKRIEALEISVQKLSSVVQTIMKTNIEQTLNDNIQEPDKTQHVVDEIDEELSRVSEEIISETVISKDSYTVNDGMSNTYQHVFNGINEKVKAVETRLNAMCESINQNHYFLLKKICNAEETLKSSDEKFKDLFYVCEHMEEKIDDAILSFDDFKSKMFCLKANVKQLMDMSVEANEKINNVSNVYENLQHTKADLLFVNDVVVNGLERMSSKVKDFNTLANIFNQDSQNLTIQAEKFSKIISKFKNDIQQAIHFLKSLIDEKCEKNAVEKLKESLTKQFDNFVRELKAVLLENSKKYIAKGTTTDCLKCISCENDVLMNLELMSEQEKPTNKPKKSSKKKNQQVSQDHQTFSCASKESFLNFPSMSQQCFIISRDNEIFKADPLKCLLNPKYTVNKC